MVVGKAGGTGGVGCRGEGFARGGEVGAQGFELRGQAPFGKGAQRRDDAGGQTDEGVAEGDLLSEADAVVKPDSLVPGAQGFESVEIGVQPAKMRAERRAKGGVGIEALALAGVVGKGVKLAKQFGEADAAVGGQPEQALAGVAPVAFEPAQQTAGGKRAGQLAQFVFGGQLGEREAARELSVLRAQLFEFAAQARQ